MITFETKNLEGRTQKNPNDNEDGGMITVEKFIGKCLLIFS